MSHQCSEKNWAVHAWWVGGAGEEGLGTCTDRLQTTGLQGGVGWGGGGERSVQGVKTIHYKDPWVELSAEQAFNMGYPWALL